MDHRNDNWKELDSDEIASIASEDLYEHRPNRWTGSKSTWRTLTEEERLLWQSMKRLGDQDLAMHLYNAFALKKRARDPSTAQDLTIQTENGKEAIWAPPKLWTAWPLGECRLPKEDFVAREEDEDDEFTFRKNETKMPSSDLHEELNALILRTAKDKFRRRLRKWNSVRPSVEDQVVSTVEGQSEEQQDSDVESKATASAPGSRATSASPQSGEESEKMEMDEEENDGEQLPGPSGPRRIRKQPRTYAPEVSTNDEESHKLLTPSIRHILSQMDMTLQILHQTRAAGLTYASDSSTADEESDNPSGSPKKRSRGRPRKDDSLAGDQQKQKATRRGRPRKLRVPLEGESHEEMLIRIARKSHRRLPEKPQPDPESAFEDWLREGDEKLKREQSQTENEQDEAKESTRRGFKTWGLRDWSDVVGAASLAGFSSDVIARTTKRCADLFGQSMVIRKLQEVPASHGTGVQTMNYIPEPINLSRSDADSSSSEEDAEAARLQRRIASRQSSVALSSPSLSSPSPRSRSRSRSASRSSAGNQHFCPIPTCDRAGSGFSRRANLKRHMALVHGGEDAEEVDSEDEVYGAVHVDGFLKAVVPSKGWRGEDMTVRKRKRVGVERRGRSEARSGSASEDE